MTEARVLQYVEIDVDYCSLTYSVAPCYARLNTDVSDTASLIGDTNTKLVLRGEGEDGSTTFTDASLTEKGNATVNGNAQVDTSQSKQGYGSILLDGSGDYLTFPDHADWDFGTSNFTVDWWERRSASQLGAAICRDGTTNFTPFIFGFDDGASPADLQVYITSDGATWDIANGRSLGTLSLNTWSHRAITRSGTTFRAFKDGVQTDTWTSSAAIFGNANPLSIGRYLNTNYFAGWLDEVRIIVGTALWTANFTPPTRALSAVSGTQKCFNTIATCQARDVFTNSPQTLRFAVPTADLPGSIECIPNIKEIRFEPATVSLGENLGQRASLTVSFDDHRHSDTGAGFDKYLADRTYNPYMQGTFWGKFRTRQRFLRGRPLRWITGLVGQSLAEMETRHYIIDSFTGPDPSGKFQIIAKDILKLADGDRALAPRVSNGFLVSDITNSQTTLTLSPSGIGSEYPWTGYVAIGGSEICRFYNATTQLLLHFDGADAAVTTEDSTGFFTTTFTFTGDAQLDTAQKKFGTASLLLDGVGDAFNVASSTANFAFGTGDFTIELWFRASALPATNNFLYDQRPAGTNGLYPSIYIVPGKTLRYLTNSADRITGTTVLVTGQWYHLSVCRSGTSTRMFLDGVQEGSTYSDSNNYINGASRPIIGNDGVSTVTPFAGWIDEVIVKKGMALRTANFTPPTAAFDGTVAESNDTLTIVRGQLNTTAASHSTQDRVQLVLRYVSMGPEDIIADLLENYAGVDPSYIPLSTWHTEISVYLNRVYSATIPQPTSVNALISELIEQAGLSMWWDDRNQQIGLLVLRGLIYTTGMFDETNTMVDSLTITEQPDKRLSQVHTYFGQINSLTSLTDKANFRSVSRVIDAQAETDYGSASIKEIFSRWIPALGRTVADRLGAILLGRFRDPPRHLKISVLRNSTNEIQLARGYQAQSWLLQDDTGDAETVNLQVTRLRPSADILEVEADEVIFTAPTEDTGVRNIVIDSDINDINLRTVHDTLYQTPQSGDVVVLTIVAGVIVGSTSAATPALDIGSWPSGVTIIVNIQGGLRGKGGNGGATAEQGGSALYTRYAIDLALSGTLYGGGGAGGWAGDLTRYVYNGGGGAGRNPGAGGAYWIVLGIVGGNGTLTTGGAGSTDGTGNGIGGNGGTPGVAGSNGTGGVQQQAGGAAGNSIDGVSFVTTGTWDAGSEVFTPGGLGGTVLGPQVN